MADLTTKEIASRIDVHLKRFEADPVINASVEHGGMKTPPYFTAGAYAAGRYVRVQYVSYQGTSTLERDVARRYLAWLDGGHVGTHYDRVRAAR